MENFDEALRDIDSFCKVTVKKAPGNQPETNNGTTKELAEESMLQKVMLPGPLQTGSPNETSPTLFSVEEPLVDVIDEEDQVRILVQCRCREQEVTFHACSDGIRICREECQKEPDGTEVCQDVCRKVNIPTSHLQIENMLFIIAKCNNNNTLEAMIPKIKQ